MCLRNGKLHFIIREMPEITPVVVEGGTGKKQVAARGSSLDIDELSIDADYIVGNSIAGGSRGPSVDYQVQSPSRYGNSAVAFGAGASTYFFERSQDAEHSLPAKSSSRKNNGPHHHIGFLNIGGDHPSSKPARFGGYQIWTGSGGHDDDMARAEQTHLGTRSPRRRRATWGRKAWFVMIMAALLFGICLLIFWLVFVPHELSLSIKNITVQGFLVAQGEDATGVPTQVVSLECVTSMVLSNPSKFFMVQMRGGDLSIIYLGVTIAEGQIQEMDLPKNSNTNVSATVSSQDVPAYGVGYKLADAYAHGQEIPLQVEIHVKSGAHALLTPKFSNSAHCTFQLNLSNVQITRQQCTY